MPIRFGVVLMWRSAVHTWVWASHLGIVHEAHTWHDVDYGPTSLPRGGSSHFFAAQSVSSSATRSA